MIYFFPLSMLAWLSLLVGLNSSSPLFFSLWLSSLTGILICYLWFDGCGGSSVSLYLIEEMLSLLMMVVWLILGGGTLLGVLLVVKSGLAPFHKWFIDVLSGSTSSTFIWGLTFHKMPSVVLLVFISSYSVQVVLLMSFIVGILLLFSLGETRMMLILSSSNSLVLIILLFVFNSVEGLLLLVCYISVLWSAAVVGRGSIDSVFILLGLMGLPPLLLLEMKWSVVCSLLGNNWLSTVVYTGCAGLSMVVYVRLTMTLSLDFNVVEGMVLFTLWMVVSLLLPTF